MRSSRVVDARSTLRLVIVGAVIVGGCGSDETSDASGSLPHHDGGTPAEGFEGVLATTGGVSG
jgi:hypothetical protein